MDMNDLKNRFKFHPATDEEKRNDHASVREACLQLALFINGKVPEGREKALAITHLEEVMMWANAGIARNATPEHMKFDHNLFQCEHPTCVRDAKSLS